MNKLNSLSLLLLLSGMWCSGANAEDIKIYKGLHFGTLQWLYRPFASSTDEKKVTFNDSNRYEFTGDAVSDQADINKLFGFTDCFTTHHQNSARFGWRWYQNHLELFGYTYVHGKRDYQQIQSVDLNRPVRLKIAVKGSQYEFYVNGEKKIQMKRGCSNAKAYGYRLGLFFGGNRVAPHDMSVRFE